MSNKDIKIEPADIEGLPTQIEIEPEDIEGLPTLTEWLAKHGLVFQGFEFAASAPSRKDQTND